MKPRFRSITVAVIAAGSLVVSACSAGSLGSSDDSGGNGKVTLSLMFNNTPATVASGEAVAKEFSAKNPNITIKVESRPGGTEGDNLIKTRLSTGDMTDMFEYNTGSLLQAVAPQKNLVPLDDQPWAAQLADNFKSSVSVDGKAYGAPWGAFFAGAIMYNKAVYAKLNLQVPKTWSEFMANNAKIKAAGIAPVIQSYQDTWTSQLFVLGDFHNVAAAEPDFADKYTKNQAKYATDPAAIKGFQHLQEVHDAGYLNKDFASTTYNNALKKLANGEGAHYPMLSSAITEIVANYPDKVKDIGLFPIPGDDATKNGLTVWSPSGIYIPKTVQGAKLDAAKKFLAYIASPEGCAAQAKASTPVAPYAVKGCELPADVTQVAKDTQPYLDKPGGSSLALEFLSPIKGPSLEQITVEVGSGIRQAQAGAALYDEDVKKQAQQLGLQGW